MTSLSCLSDLSLTLVCLSEQFLFSVCLISLSCLFVWYLSLISLSYLSFLSLCLICLFLVCMTDLFLSLLSVFLSIWSTSFWLVCLPDLCLLSVCLSVQSLQGVKVRMFCRQNESNSGYDCLALTSIFGLCFMSVCLIKSNCYSLIYSSLVPIMSQMIYVLCCVAYVTWRQRRIY